MKLVIIFPVFQLDPDGMPMRFIVPLPVKRTAVTHVHQNVSSSPPPR